MGPMRSFWCYGSERFWNFCGHMIKDRAHPLANFINAFNLRRSVDEVPPAWAEEVISYAAQHDEIKHIKSAVEHMQGTPPEPVHGLRALSAISEEPEAGVRFRPVGPALRVTAVGSPFDIR